MEVAYACLEHPHLWPAHLGVKKKSFTAEIAMQVVKPGFTREPSAAHRSVKNPAGRLKGLKNLLPALTSSSSMRH